MSWLRPRSLRNKLLLVVITTTLTALLVACVAMEAYDLRTYQSSSINELSTEADVVGQATAAALSFDDPKTAQDNLRLLVATPRVIAGAIYTKDGRLFASYVQSGAGSVAIPPAPEADGSRIAGRRLIVFKRIQVGEERIGTVFVEGRYEVLERFTDYLGILTLIMAAGLGAAILLSYRLNAAVSRPILEISSVAKRVMQSRNFGLRAQKMTEDETGELADSFNDMLAELGRAAEALRLADRQKDDFLATLAHELRNPLAPIRHAARINSEPGSTEEQRSWARDVTERQVAHMARLLDDLLDVSRITRGKMELRQERLDLKETLLGVVETIRPQIEERGHALSMLLPSWPLYVSGDPVRLTQIFSNLLTNAAKYTDTGGIIKVTVEQHKDTVIVSIEDNGIGISPESLPRLFEMFSQAESALTRSEGGLGIGLALTRGLIRLHRGSIEAHSAGIGMGSTFIVTLPLNGVESYPVATLPTAATAAPEVQALRILVVDDNRDNADTCTTLLEMFGYTLKTGYSGTDALRLAAEFNPQVVLLDIGMPDMNGYEVARQLRQTEQGRAMTLIAITGWGQVEDKLKSKEAGFDVHLSKPVDFDELRWVITDAQATPPPAV